MANSVANVTPGKPKVTGAIYTALVSANPTIPTDATTDLASGFECVGYISEDGVKRAKEISAETIKAWGGDTVLITRTENSTNFTWKMIEYLSDIVQKVAYGSTNVTGTLSTGMTVKDVPSYSGEERVWVIDQIMAGNVKSRTVIPKADITSIGEIAYTDADAAGIEVTVNAKPDSTGAAVYEYLKATS
jgi:hypothetical protein